MPRNPNKIDYSGGLPEGFEVFQIIEDPRTGHHKKHHFGEVLFMVTVATLCGMNNFSEVEDFCETQIQWLQKWITLPHGIPRAQTFANIFALISPKHFNDCLRAHLGSISAPLRDEIIAIDGKSLRGSHTAKQGPVHVVSAWATSQRVTICQDHVQEKQNEIAAIGRILNQLDLEGHTITLDAMGTQREFAKIIAAKKGHYLFALKGNQGSLHKEAIDHFELPPIRWTQAEQSETTRLTMKSNTGKTYTDQFRQDALDLLQNSHKSMAQIARELGISSSTLRNWKKAALKNTPMLPMSKEKAPLSAEELYAQNQQLKKEIDSLRRQRDILKKAASILAEDPQLGLR